MAVSIGTAGKMAMTVASRGSRGVTSRTSRANGRPSVNSSRARASRTSWNCSIPRRVSTTTGRSRLLSSSASPSRRAASRVSYPATSSSDPFWTLTW